MINFTKLFKVTSKSTIRPELNLLYQKDKKIYATNSFMAIAMNVDSEEEGYILKEDAMIADLRSKEHKVLVSPKITENDDKYTQFPNVEAIRHSDFQAELKFERTYLIDILTALQKDEVYDEVIIKVPTSKLKPLTIENRNGTGFIMQRS